MIAIRRPETTDAAGVGRAWEDAREFYSNLDGRAFLGPDPDDRELGQAVADKLASETSRPDRWIRVAEVDGEAVGFISATLHESLLSTLRSPSQLGAQTHSLHGDWVRNTAFRHKKS